MVLLIDNYDSFSYNLYQLAGSLGKEIKVVKNNEITLKEIDKLNPSHIIISPGPGAPKDAGISEEAVRWRSGKSKIFGVCLGHQAICEAFGGRITYAKQLMHGRQCECEKVADSAIFRGLPQKFAAARYHSLAADGASLPDCLRVTAYADDEIMAVEHTRYPIYGLQFHPESVLTPLGGKIIENFLEDSYD